MTSIRLESREEGVLICAVLSFSLWNQALDEAQLFNLTLCTSVWPGLYVSLSRGRLPPVINHSTLACVSLSRSRLPLVINHSTLACVCHYPGADCHQSSTIPPWPMCVTIQGQTATSHQPFHPGLCVSLSRCRLPPVINHSTLAYVCHYPGADCHQSSTIPPWPMCVSLSRGRLNQSSTIPPWPMCVTIQGQTATSHQPFHPGLCVSLSRGRLPPVINHSTLTCVCHIHAQTATSHQPFHPGLCVSLSMRRLPLVINHSTLTYVCHYPGADCHQSSTIPP